MKIYKFDYSLQIGTQEEYADINVTVFYEEYEGELTITKLETDVGDILHWLNSKQASILERTVMADWVKQTVQAENSALVDRYFDDLQTTLMKML